MSSQKNYNHLFTFEGGDVNLITMYKGKRVVGKVASQAMVLASPVSNCFPSVLKALADAIQVWKKLLFQPPISQLSQDKAGEQSSTKSGHQTPRTIMAKEIDCGGDDGGALLILLRIAHLQFNENPKNLFLIQLFDIAGLCEKYDCHDLIRPWSGRWITSLRHNVGEWAIGDCRWIYIAWAFGIQDIFQAAALNIIKQVYLSGLDRRPTVRWVRRIDREPMPDRIVGEESLFLFSAWTFMANNTLESILDTRAF